MKKYIFIIVPLLLIICFLVFLSSAKVPDYIFLITLDTTRADYINYSLSDQNKTKHFAYLASEGVYFKNAYALIPITLPSHAAMFYSLPPHLLKVYNNGQQCKVPHHSFVKSLKKAGYQTGAVVSLGVLKSKFGLNIGFDEYLDDFSPSRWYKTAEEVNRETFKLLNKWSGQKIFLWIHYSDPHSPYFPPLFYGDLKGTLNQQEIFHFRNISEIQVNVKSQLNPGKNNINLEITLPDSIIKNELIKIKNFVFMDFNVSTDQLNKKVDIIFPSKWKKKTNNQKTHHFSTDPYSRIIAVNNSSDRLNVSITFRFKILLNQSSRKFLYGEEVKYMDEKFGELITFLKQKGIYEKSFFVVMGDHGEGLGEHRRFFGHIHYLNKIYSRVPLIIAGQGVRQRSPREDLVSNLNVVPTILEVANIKKFDYMQGESLLNQIKPQRLLMETYSPEARNDAFSLIDFPYQIIFYKKKKKNRLEFFDLREDKLGIMNRLEDKKNKKIKVELINSVKRIAPTLIRNKGRIGNLSESDRLMLKSLGYL